MKKNKILILVFFSCITVLLMTPTATGVKQGLAKGQIYPAPFLRGNQIDILLASNQPVTEIEIPADEACFVIHGWLTPNFQKASPENKKAIFGDDLGFELRVGGENIILRTHIHYYKELYDYINDQWFVDVMTKEHYVQFDPNHFSTGEVVTFTGIWISPGGSWEYTLSVKFT